MSFEHGCEAGCMNFTGGELRHDKNCRNYPGSLSEMMDKLRARVAQLEQALELIAAPKRSDGTYNRSREACEQIARAALDGRDEKGKGV